MTSYRPFKRQLPLASALLFLPLSAPGDLVGYWKLDGDFFDSSGNENDGQFNGGFAYQSDSPAALGGGQSVSFDGQPGTYGEINPGTGGLGLTANPAFTISMWVKGDGTLNSDDRVFSEGMTTDANPLFNIGTHNTSANGTVDFYIRNGAGAQTFGHAYSNGTAFDDTWHHIAAVSEGKVIQLYIDGSPDRQFDYNNVPDFTPSTTTIGGILRDTDCCNFLGSIDEIAVWDTTLTAGEVALLASGTAADSLDQDADADGLPDAWEALYGLATDDDGSVDPDNGPDGDPDNDGATNIQEFNLGSDPTNPDADDDGLNDGGELAAGSDPFNPDTDGDGLEDGEEIDRGTNPNLADSDGDGLSDPDEITNGTDPTDIESPAIADLLAAYWPLDSTDGSTTPDAGPNGYDLELTNMDSSNFVSDEGRTAASFDGLEEFLFRTHEASDELPISKNPAFTISLWVKIAGAGQSDLRFFSESSVFNGDPLFNLGTQNQGLDNRFDVYLRDQGTPNHQYSIGEPLDGTWHHLAYTHNDVNQTIQLYIDGVLDRDDWIFKDIVSPDLNTTSIGAILRDVPSFWVQGLVDEVSLWTGVMSPAKIAALAAGTTPDEIAGTGPFQITSVTRNDNGSVSLTWNSRENTTYVLEASKEIDNGWTELDDGVASQGDSTTITVQPGIPGFDTSVEPRLFFRVRR